jgi:hypothetical protein
MPDDPNPNPEVPEQTSFPFNQPAPLSNAPIIPEWVKQKTETCAEPNCGNKIDPANTFRDPHTNKQYCVAHEKECENCSTHHYIGEMIEKDRYWYDRDCYAELFAKCPNCKEVVLTEDIYPPTRNNRWQMKNGGCKECSFICNGCQRVADKDYATFQGGDNYCEDCYHELFTNCEECGDTITREEGHYVDDVGEFCQTCYKDKFVKCQGCNTIIERSSANEIVDDYYCDECYQKPGPEAYIGMTETLTNFTYTKKDRYLNLLDKLLPISSKNLKSKHPTIAAGLQDLISFARGGMLTAETVQSYRATLSPEDFPVAYTVWDGAQRSIDEMPNELRQQMEDKPQLVINILASSQMLATLKNNPAMYSLFDQINSLSRESGHPYIKDQIGWARIEIASDKSYMLVDEIQSDHSNAANRLRNDDSLEITKIRKTLRTKYNLDQESFNKLLNEYGSLMKDFPNIATQAVNRFAKNNAIKKIFWHTYESGKKLKDNEPPRSLYEKVPKENFFLPSQEKPFGLNGEFLEKEARQINRMYKLARRMFWKYCC